MPWKINIHITLACANYFFVLFSFIIAHYFLAATKPDPNAPRPEGQTLRPVVGELLQVQYGSTVILFVDHLIVQSMNL